MSATPNKIQRRPFVAELLAKRGNTLIVPGLGSWVQWTVVPLLILGRYSHLQFWITLAVCTLAAAESLAIILTRDRVDENIGSILVRRSLHAETQR